MSATLVDMGKHDRQADKDADFSAYMSGRQTALYRTAYLLAGDHAGAEDLLQTAFAKLYLSWDRIRDREALDGYVRRIMVNENNSLWRRAWKRREHATDTVPETGAVDVYDDGMGGALWSFVQTLPPKQRSVVVLRYYEQLSEAEIADVLGISVGTVKSRPAARWPRCAPVPRTPSTPTSPETMHDEPHSPRGPGARRAAPHRRPPAARPVHRHRRPDARPSDPAPPRRGGRRHGRRRPGDSHPCRRRRGRADPAERRPARDPDARTPDHRDRAHRPAQRARRRRARRAPHQRRRREPDRRRRDHRPPPPLRPADAVRGRLGRRRVRRPEGRGRPGGRGARSRLRGARRGRADEPPRRVGGRLAHRLGRVRR